ncbi:M48 family metallopeptidase [Hymenobacter sp. HSC-4F20]|uniref:M48 family metallopeptidase n=1 Tax=Hymenobacter sp. HSC-4F20 TaxID=2864135 RepID=UPI001C73A68C|nr:SprT family zinc-dependent metalloprotease [Hymenobacter sp. HSC-4F20]MBX0289504.1 M48 family metallopeptidase [Hymenobacter sp. HSC-4F20]
MNKTVQIGDLAVEVVRKSIRTMRVTVYPPVGRVRVAAPLRLPDETIREFVLSRQAWIHRHQARFAAQPHAPTLAYCSGETHYYQGRPYQLRVHATTGRPCVKQTEEYIHLFVREDSTLTDRAKVLAAWYRAHLKEQIPALLAHWEPIVGARAEAWGVKQMKTRWGTCNIQARRIWLSLELAKKPVGCLEYVVVHELVHLHERLHNARFWGLMDQFMPDWRQHKAALQAHPTGQESGAGPDAD